MTKLKEEANWSLGKMMLVQTIMMISGILLGIFFGWQVFDAPPEPHEIACDGKHEVAVSYYNIDADTDFMCADERDFYLPGDDQ